MHFPIAPLGIATLVIARDPILLATAAAAYAVWRTDTPSEPPRITLSLDRGDASTTHVSLDIRVAGSRLTMIGAGIDGEADARTGEARCRVPPRLAGDPAALAEATDTLLMFLLARSGRTPLHAAGILLDGRALILAGPSGSGKSTLALAAARRGLALLSDDMVFVDLAGTSNLPSPSGDGLKLSPRLRLWGFPGPIHVFPRDAPEGPHPMRSRAGKLKAAVPIADPAGQPPVADEACLILLEHGERLGLTPLTRQQAIDGIGPLEPGFDLLPRESAEAIRALAADGAWRLTLSRDPGAAIDFLCAHFAAERV